MEEKDNWLKTKLGRFICSKENPMPQEGRKWGNWEHDDVHEIDCSCDCCARYVCKSCGHTWKSELPQ